MIRPLLVLFIGVICFVTVSGQDGKYNCQVFYKPFLFAIANESAKMGTILDYSTQHIVVLNGQRSSIIVVDLPKQVRYYVENQADTQNGIWSSFSDYFGKLASLEQFLEIAKDKGEESKLDTPKKRKVGRDLREVFNSLGGSSVILEERELVTKFMEGLRGPLSLMYTESGSFNIFIGVNEFAKVNLAVAELLKFSKDKLSPDNLKLNTTDIFEAPNGAEVLLKVLSQAGKHYDLIQQFDVLFASPEKVQSLLINATGGSNNGLDGLITILADYVGVSNGKSTFARLVNSILSYNPRTGQSLDNFVNQMLSEVANQDERFHNADGFSLYISILKGIITHDYPSDNMSLSEIIAYLPAETRKSLNPLFTIVKLLSSFYPTSVIPHFFGSAIKQYNVTMDTTPENSDAEVYYIQRVVPSHSFIAFINQIEKMAVMIDITSPLMVVINGNRSTMIVIDISEQVIYYLKNETDTINSFWSNFRGFLHKRSSLQPFLKTGQEKGENSKLDTLEGSEPVLRDLVEVSRSLGASLPIPEELTLHTKLIKQLRGALTAVYKDAGGFEIASGGDAFIKVNLGMAALLTGSEE